ncbi:HNH endonuclease [Candidatus Atribacteria bacterium 1244-E10-H5-B2]|nr:MAG: HNH endonuclease [Candidatus Atribacteria bacterium 1244-E10-H5-B2]
MPYKPKKSCSYPLCNKLVETGITYCDKHKKKVSKAYQIRRTDIEEQTFYKSYRWRKLRKYKLSRDPLCAICLREEIVKEAAMVDHIKPIKNSGDLMAMDNLQSLCVPCHNRKKVKEMKG